MDRNTLKGDWLVAREQIKQKYPQLVDDDLAYTRGSEDELIDRIQKRVGAPREEVARTVEEIITHVPEIPAESSVAMNP